jgi:hypothetical protein
VAPTPPDAGVVAAPTPPAVAPAGDDRGAVPVTPVPPVTPVAPVVVVVPSADPGPTAPVGEVTAGKGSDQASAASQDGWDSPQVVPRTEASRGSAAAPPLARDAAWARGPVRDGIVATATLALLGLLLLLGAIVGRRGRRGGYKRG